ncbi:MAG: hypothetical protein V5A31_11665 [Haloferacaceae archaeon]
MPRRTRRRRARLWATLYLRVVGGPTDEDDDPDSGDERRGGR